MRFYEKIPLREGDKKILVVFLVLGAIWAIFLGPDFLKNSTAPADWLFAEPMEDFSHGAGSFIKGLIGLLLMALVGILWVFLWLLGLLKLQYVLFGALYATPYALLFIVLLRRFLKILGVDSRFLAT